MKQKIYNILVLAILLLMAVSPASASIQRASADLPIGGSIDADLGDSILQINRVPYTTTAESPTPSPTDTAEPTAQATDTPIPATSTPVPTNTPDTSAAEVWHAPGAHVGLDGSMLNAHDHGKPVPQCVANWIAQNADVLGTDHLVFGGDESTPNENLKKHQGFKIYSDTFIDKAGHANLVTVRMHMMTSPAGEASIFHSMEVYVCHFDGTVSFFQGWPDFAEGAALDPNSATSNFMQYPDGCIDPSYPFMHTNNPAGRPRMIINTIYCYDLLGRGNFDSWYPDFHNVLGEYGFTVCDTYFFDGDPTDPSTWTPFPGFGNCNGLARRFEVTLRRGTKPFGPFYADQFGRIMTGLNDPRCGQTVTAHGIQNLKVICLYQYLSPTFAPIGSPGNAFQEDYPGPVTLPN